MLYVYGAIALVMVALGGYAGIEHYRAEGAIAEKAAVQGELVRAMATAAANAQAVADLQAEVTRQQGIAAEARQLADRRAATNTALRRSIDRAPTTDDGPTAPVLRRTLDGLRDGPAAGAH